LKIVNILGSPRKNGTSTRIARAFTEGAAIRGAEVTEYHLNGMQYRGCQACEGCHTRSDQCVLKDDLTPLLADIHTADIVVLATPIYFGDTSGQFKCFFDRTWSLVSTEVREEDNSSRLSPGKTALLILSQVDTADAHLDVRERYTMHLELLGFNVQVITAAGHRLQSDADVSPSLYSAAELARKLMQDR